MSADRQAVVETARGCLAEILGVGIEQIPADADLSEELDVDSLQQLELTAMLEESFGVTIDADDLSEMKTIQDLAEVVLQRAGRSG